ncbi:unnamed protein product [Ceutorhynchus assimilis]|uniref:Aminopeptidase n=1 Tax=Ceutorhynchus assimilis TaxID=467358 RepID=A0A9P0GRN0_9CUCU|nr:unnamed protein product [Ceutorhynchus assimilis]
MKDSNMKQVQLLTVPVLLTILSTAFSYRLPTIYSPSLYTIHLVVPPEVFTTENATSYTGNVSIAFTTSENVSQVVLHASAEFVNITSCNLVDGSGTSAATNISRNSTTDLVNVTFDATLAAGNGYTLELVFTGKLSTKDMYGFYKSSYQEGNATSYLVTTQMEPMHARRAFPCFDEPQYKANFSISLTYPSGLSALGNMAGTDTNNTTTNTTTTVFNTTPSMPTYLVAFIISDFTCTSGNDIEGTLPYQVCSRNETSDTRGLAVEVAPLSIDHLNTYLGLNYSENMEKLDQVAIPDFSAGAMENWGLITYRERGLLFDENETSNAYQQYIASVISHELAHQWFGNLVTCKWWSEIFLNEGFATFFEYFITHEIYPQFEMDNQFVLKTLQYIFEEDSSSTEALRNHASSQSEITARFGGITYDKGGSVLRMVQHILGTDDWIAKLNVYLNTFAHSSAEPEDLWRILGTNLTDLPADNLTVIMENWIDTPGYPVVHASLNQTQLTLTQERFVLSNKTSKNNTWYVPLTYTTSENTSHFQNTTPVAWLTPNSSLNLTVSSNLSWIVLNNLQTGYYRVNYDSNLWLKLATALQQTNFSGIPEINRAQIVNDAFNLARAGHITYTQLFNIVAFLSQETSYTVWYPAFSGFSYLLKRIGINSTLGAAISEHVLNLTSTVVASVPITSTNSSNHIYTLNQVQAQSWACKLGSSNCTSEAVRLFEAFKNTSTRPDKNLRSIVYCYGLKYSSDVSSDWATLWNAYLSTSLSTEQVTILSALGCSENETILNSYLSKTLSGDSGIRSQDYALVFAAVYSSSTAGVSIALDFLDNNYDHIIARYTSLNGVGNIIKGIAEQITTSEQLAKLENLIKGGKLNSTVLELANAALSSAHNNEQWVDTHKSSLYTYYGLPDDSNSNATTLAPSTTTQSGAFKSSLTLGLVFLWVLLKMF